MSERFSRIAAVIGADLRIRFRRPSTLVVFLLLSGLAYVWVPAPSSGSTLMLVNGQRALYNSAAVAVGTATLATIFVGLAGFYVVSNAIRRDVASRCGFVIASTTMRGSEYLFGKFAGNVVFLLTFMTGFMLTSMAMVIVRGEAPLQPLVFIWQYFVLVPPSVVFVSAVAILFESVPFLSGKFGDVAYFFLWAATLGIVGALIEQGRDPGVAAYFDFSGFGFLFDSMRRTLHTTQVAIGHTPFDATKGAFVFKGLIVDRSWLMPRIVATIAPVALLFVARPFFHRFDPARLKQGGAKSSRNWMARFASMGKPLTRMLWRVMPRSGSRFSAAWADAVLTVSSAPVTLIAAVVVAVMSLAMPPKTVMPVAFAVAAVAIADIACREKRAGTMALVFTSPRLKSGFVIWKLMSTGATASLILFVPAVRMITARPSSAIYVLTGIAFIVSLATLLGIVSANAKTFLLLFLTFWYVVVNDGGHMPALDFAGWSGIATPAVVVSYLALSAAAVTAAELYHRLGLRRNW